MTSSRHHIYGARHAPLWWLCEMDLLWGLKNKKGQPLTAPWYLKPALIHRL